MTRSGTAARYAASASSRIRKRPLSRSIGSRRSVPIDSNSTGDARPPAALAGGAAEGRHQPEVVEDHRPDVEDERLRRVERLLDHRDELADLALGRSRVAGHEALHDLGLEDDVRQALGRAVVHRAGDLAAQVLLGAEDHPRHGRRHDRLAVGAAGAVGSLGAARRRASPRSRRSMAVGEYSATASRYAAERPPLALEDLDLGLHQGRAPGQRDELGVSSTSSVGGRRRPCRRAASFSAAAARRVSCRAASVRAWLTSRSISASSPSRRRDVVGQPRGSSARLAGGVSAVGVGHRRTAVAGTVVGRHQSSGIRIQPWRIAYTTAWVRSLTESLRRIELMWFLTVCSLIDRA